MIAPLSPSMICAGVFGLLLRQRRAKGLTQADVSKRLRVSLSTFKRWERGLGEPTFEDAVRWMCALDIAPSFKVQSESVSSDTLETRSAGETPTLSFAIPHSSPLVAHVLEHVATSRSLHGNSPRADFQSAEVAR